MQQCSHGCSSTSSFPIGIGCLQWKWLWNSCVTYTECVVKLSATKQNIAVQALYVQDGMQKQIQGVLNIQG